jgi:hypothetical protein
MASQTRLRVTSEIRTLPFCTPFRTIDTVARETPAALATSDWDGRFIVNAPLNGRIPA